MGIFGRRKKFLGEDISNLKTGTKVEISKLESEDSEFILNTKLEEILSEDKIILLAPISKGVVIKLPQNLTYSIIFKTKKGIFKNTIKIKEYIIKDGVPFIIVNLLEETKKIQRRESFRFKTSIDVKFDIIEEVNDDIFYSDDPLICLGKTEDISDGGIKFFSNQKLIEGDLIKMEISLNQSLIYTIGSILCAENTISSPFKYSYKASFKRIDHRDKEVISKYIFEQQKSLSRVGRLMD